LKNNYTNKKRKKNNYIRRKKNHEYIDKSTNWALLSMDGAGILVFGGKIKDIELKND
jgi:hypothetical protein